MCEPLRFSFFSTFFHHFVCFRRTANQFQAYFYEPTVQHGELVVDGQTLAQWGKGTSGWDCLAGAAALVYFSNVPNVPRPRARAIQNWPCVRR